jgi:hypothetical protein
LVLGSWAFYVRDRLEIRFKMRLRARTRIPGPLFESFLSILSFSLKLVSHPLEIFAL